MITPDVVQKPLFKQQAKGVTASAAEESKDDLVEFKKVGVSTCLEMNDRQKSGLNQQL